MEKMIGKSLIDITCDVMPEIVKDICGKDEKFAEIDIGQISSEAISAVRAKEINLLTRGALEEKIFEIAAAKLNKS